MRPRPSKSRRGFTLIELLIAGVITAFILGAVSVSVSQIIGTKNTAKQRYDAFLRADSAMNALRREIVSIIRSDDLFQTRFQLRDDSTITPAGDFDRDDLLIFNTRLQQVHDYAYIGQGMEFETQFRVTDDPAGSVLWERRDAQPDPFELGGGTATPLVEGVVSLNIEAFDGLRWYDQWDSDEDGLPYAVRVTVVATGARDGEPLERAPLATLRTVVALDRMAPPADLFPDEELPAADGAAGGAGGGTSGGGTGATGNPNATPDNVPGVRGAPANPRGGGPRGGGQGGGSGIDEGTTPTPGPGHSPPH